MCDTVSRKRGVFYYKNAICQDMHTSENKESESSLDEDVFTRRRLDGQIKTRFNIRSVTLKKQQKNKGALLRLVSIVWILMPKSKIFLEYTEYVSNNGLERTVLVNIKHTWSLLSPPQ